MSELDDIRHLLIDAMTRLVELSVRIDAVLSVADAHGISRADVEDRFQELYGEWRTLFERRLAAATEADYQTRLRLLLETIPLPKH